MKYKIEELKDITDSREIMQSSPKGFSRYMTYIIIALLTAVIIWSLIANKEVSVTASGVVNPRGDVSSISSDINGSLTSINVKDGDNVKKGDVLFTINAAEYTIQKDSIQKSLDKNNDELNALNLLKKSILDDKSYFDTSNDTQNEYYKKYQLYLQNYKNNGSQQGLMAEQKNEINDTINKLNLLKKSIQDGVNNFKEGDTYYYQYVTYINTISSYDKTTQDYQTQIDTLKSSENDQNKLEVENQITTLTSSIDSSKVEKEKYINTTLGDITSKIDDNQKSLSQLTVTTTSDNYKEEYISNLETSITSMENSISEEENNIKSLDEKIDSTSVKAPCDGVLSLNYDMNNGTYIQGGTEIAKIIPEGASEYEVNVYINNQDFGQIKDGQDVTIELVSLPGNDYGYINTSIKDISVDARVSQEKGTSYYTGKCDIEQTSMKNKKGDVADIKNGMIAKVKIVNRKVSYFRYFLEKIDILN